MENISSKEIIEDINNMKDVRQEILSHNYDFDIWSKEKVNKLFKFLESANYVNRFVFDMLMLVIVKSILLFVISHLSFSGVLYLYRKRNKEWDEKLNTLKNLKSNCKENIDEFIDNHEAILEHRKGKELTQGTVKNLNICFSFDPRYTYDLQQINHKYNFKPSDKEINNSEYIFIDDFYKSLKGFSKSCSLELDTDKFPEVNNKVKIKKVI